MKRSQFIGNKWSVAAPMLRVHYHSGSASGASHGWPSVGRLESCSFELPHKGPYLHSDVEDCSTPVFFSDDTVSVKTRPQADSAIPCATTTKPLADAPDQFMTTLAARQAAIQVRNHRCAQSHS